MKLLWSSDDDLIIESSVSFLWFLLCCLDHYRGMQKSAFDQAAVCKHTAQGFQRFRWVYIHRTAGRRHFL